MKKTYTKWNAWVLDCVYDEGCHFDFWQFNSCHMYLGNNITNCLFWARNFQRIIKLQKRIGNIWYSSLFGSNGFWYEMCFKVTNDTFSCLQLAIYTRSRHHSYRHSISDPNNFSTNLVIDIVIFPFFYLNLKSKSQSYFILD